MMDTNDGAGNGWGSSAKTPRPDESINKQMRASEISYSLYIPLGREEASVSVCLWADSRFISFFLRPFGLPGKSGSIRVPCGDGADPAT